MTPARQLSERVVQALRGLTLDRGSEGALQAALDEVLIPLGFKSEVYTSAGRLDFHHAEARLAIEVKVQGSLNDLRRQCLRYLALPDVEEVLVITTKAVHRAAAALEGVVVYDLNSRHFVMGFGAA